MPFSSCPLDNMVYLGWRIDACHSTHNAAQLLDSVEVFFVSLIHRRQSTGFLPRA